jgi:hypothetical protein
MHSPGPQDTRRKETRYALHLPVTIWLERQGENRIKAESENISLRGILVSTNSPIAVGADVSIEVSLEAVTGQADAFLRSRGKVLRVTQPSTGGFKMAVGCEQPFQFPRGEEA